MAGYDHTDNTVQVVISAQDDADVHSSLLLHTLVKFEEFPGLVYIIDTAMSQEF